MNQPLRDRARSQSRSTAGAPSDGAEPTVAHEVGEDPEAVPVKVAWARVMRFCRALSKGSVATVVTKTGSYTYWYRGVDDVVSLAGWAFREFGVTVMPVDIQVHEKLVGNATSCRVDVTYEITSLGEGAMSGKSSGFALDFGDKALVKALQQAFRVYLTTALALPTYDKSMDSDANPVTRPQPPSALDLRDEMLNPATSLDRLRAISGELRNDDELAHRLVPIVRAVSDGTAVTQEISLWDLNVKVAQERKAAREGS